MIRPSEVNLNNGVLISFVFVWDPSQGLPNPFNEGDLSSYFVDLIQITIDDGRTAKLISRNGKLFFEETTSGEDQKKEASKPNEFLNVSNLDELL